MNKKVLAIILSIALAIGAFAGLSFNLFTANATTSTNYVGDGNELVTNGNAAAKFGIVNSGTGFSASGSSTITVVDFGDKAEGKFKNGKALLSTPRVDDKQGSRGNFGNLESMINEQGEGKYIASVWVIVPEATSAVTIGFGFGTLGTIGTREQFTVQPNTWTKLEVMQDVTSDMIYFGLYETGQTKELDFYIDNMSIQKATNYVGDGNELIANNDASDLFQIVGTNSKISTTGVATAKVTVENFEDIADGKTSNGKVLKVTPRGQHNQGNRGSINVSAMLTAQGEGKYIASVWVIVPEATSAVKIGFGFSGGGLIENRKQFTVQPNTWTKLTVMQDVTSTMINFGLYETYDTETLDIYLDDMSIQKAIDLASITPVPTVEPTPVPTPEPTPVPEVEYVGDGNELVVNGDASESFRIVGLDTTFGTVTNGSVTVVDYNDAAEGKTSNNKAVKVVNYNNTIGNRGKFGSVSFEGKYIASVWVKVPDATSAVKIAFGFDSAYNAGSRRVFTVQPNTWTKLTVMQDVTSDMKQFGLFETGDTKAIDIYIDDMSIQKAVEATRLVEYVADGNELVVNGDAGDASYTKKFGIVDSNAGLGTSGGVAVSIVEDNDAADGKVSNGKVVKATKRTNRDTGNRGHIDIRELITKQGAGKYIASVWVKVPDATEAVTIGFCFGAGTVGNREIFTVKPNTWTKLEVVCDVTTEQYIGLYDTTKDANNTTDSCNFDIYYDDMSIQKYVVANRVTIDVLGGDEGASEFIQISSGKNINYLEDKITAKVISDAEFVIALEDNDLFKIVKIYYAEQPRVNLLGEDGTAIIAAYGLDTHLVVVLESNEEASAYATLQYVIDGNANIFTKVKVSELEKALSADNLPKLYKKVATGYIFNGETYELDTPVGEITEDVVITIIYEASKEASQEDNNQVTVKAEGEGATVEAATGVITDDKTDRFTIVRFKAAETNAEGKEFAYWAEIDAEGNVTIASTRAVYTCYAIESLTLTAVYVEGEGYEEELATEAEKVAITLKVVDTNGKFVFVADRSAAKDVVIAKHGIIISEYYKDELQVSDKGTFAEGRVLVSERSNSTTPNGTYVVTKGIKDAQSNNYEAGKVLYARAYVVVDGEYIYSTQVVTPSLTLN